MISDHLNPILVKDVRSRMRGARAFLILTVFLLLAGLVSYLTYLSVSAMSRFNISMVVSGTIGRSLFYSLMTSTQILLLLTAPLLTIGAISGEVERKTYDMLLATPLTASQVVLGKLGGAGAFSLLLVFGVFPLLGIAYFFGGFSMVFFWNGLMTMAVTGLAFALVGLAFSALFRRTILAALFTYLLILLLTLGHFFVLVSLGQMVSEPPAWWMIFNPVLGELNSIGAVSGKDFLLGLDRPVWHAYLLLAWGVALLSYFVAWRAVRNRRRWRIEGSEWLAVVGMVIAFVIAVGLFLSPLGRTKLQSKKSLSPAHSSREWVAPTPMPIRMRTNGVARETSQPVTPEPLPTP